ncbi:MAG: prepilin peptidase [Anaerococcus sp.]|nr:prepilin peptidase [Anaerococcus sp.]
MVLLILFILGSIFGSFAGVIVQRSLRGESIVYPPSHCDTCNKPLKAYENIPIISFIIQQGKCRGCGKQIPRLNFLMEMIGGIFLLASSLYGLGPDSFLIFISLLFSLIIAIIDIKTMDIFISHLLVIAIPGLIFRVAYRGFSLKFFINMLVFTIIFLLIYFLSKKSLGDGDLYFYLSLGLFVKDSLFVYFCLSSVWLGGIYGLILLIKYKNPKGKMPFAIFIHLAYVLVVLIEGGVLF